MMEIAIRRGVATWLGVGGLGFVLACGGSGDRDDGANEASSSGTGDDDGSGEEAADLLDCDEHENVGARQLRRLTAEQFNASVRTVFDLSESDWPGANLPPNPASEDGFINNAGRLRVNRAFASAHRKAAESVGELVGRESYLRSSLPCSSRGDEDCAREFLLRYGRRAFRRPLTEAQLEDYLQLYRESQSDGDDFATFVRWASVGLLQSPHFLYRRELGSDEELGGGKYRLDGYEIATWLAYAYTGTGPDDALLDLARDGELNDPDGAATVARDLALHEDGRPRAGFEARVIRFFEQWLGLNRLATASKDPHLYPRFQPEIRDSMLGETQHFVSRVVFEERGGIDALLTSPTTHLDGRLVDYYGFGESGATEFGEVRRPSDWGVGLLAQGSVLAITGGNRETSPTRRGALVRTRILCGELPPPIDEVPELPEPDGFTTTRERYEKLHANDPACAGCHRLMDPLGFAFEHLDTDGRYRATEHGFEIDASGQLFGNEADLPAPTFDGLSELARVLADSPATGDCVAQFVAGDLFGVHHARAGCMVSSARRTFARDEGALLEYYLDLARSPALYERH